MSWGEWPSGKGDCRDFAALLWLLFRTESPLRYPQSIDSAVLMLKSDAANLDRNQFPGHISKYYLGNRSTRPFWAVCRIIVSNCRNVGSGSARFYLWNG